MTIFPKVWLGVLLLNKSAFKTKSSARMGNVYESKKYQRDIWFLEFWLIFRIKSIMKNFRYQIWRLVTSAPFENFILFLIILNTLLLMLKFQGAPLFFVDILSHFNLLFTLLFTIECILKLSSFGPKVSWLIIILSIVE